MSAFEDTLVAELHAEADRASSTADTVAMRLELRRRLDGARTRTVRRRWTYVVAAAAAAAVVVGLVVVAGGRDTAEVPPASPSISSAAWTGGTELLAQPQLNLPMWAEDLTPVLAPRRLVRWQQAACGQNPCPEGQDRSLAIVLPYVAWDFARNVSGPFLTWSATPGLIDSLRSLPGVTVGPLTQAPTKNAGTASLVAVTTTQDVPAALGCPQPDALADCVGLIRGTRTVVAFADAGGSPILLVSTALSSTDAAAQDAEMRAVLATLRLTGIPVACTGVIGPDAAATECLPDLWRRIERDASLQVDGGTVNQAAYDAAYLPYGQQLSDPLRGLQVPWSYERGPGLGDDGASTKDTTATWTIDGATTEANVCFRGPQLLITTDPCP